jgi:putative drug exporter of the RND superfamily
VPAWSRLVARHRVVAASAGVIVLLALAAPFLDVRFGFPDAGNNRESTSTRQAYDQIAAGFGPGMNGPLLLVAELPASGGEEALAGLADVVSEVDGVAAVTPPVVNRAGDAAILTVIPAEGPQDPATEDLVSTLRDDVLPDAVADGGLSVHVGESRLPRSTAPTTSPSGFRSSSAAWCFSRCCCCWSRSGPWRSWSRRLS